jgi:hypothetical protein
MLSDNRRPKLAFSPREQLTIKARTCRRCNLSSLSKVDDKQMEVVIGGVTDNTVGFLYAPDNRPPTSGANSEYIWVEKVADNWYLFRTT